MALSTAGLAFVGGTIGDAEGPRVDLIRMAWLGQKSHYYPLTY